MSTITIPDLTKLDECVMTTTGDHSNEPAPNIWDRKIQDIATVGQTFWYYTPIFGAKSKWRSTPDVIQQFAQNLAAANKDTWCFFFLTRNGRKVSLSPPAAREYSPTPPTPLSWQPMPAGLGPVTWETSRMPCAMVFDRMALVHPRESHDLGVFGRPSAAGGEPFVRFTQGKPTFVAERLPNGVKNAPATRRLVLAARFVTPYAVWLRA